MKLTAEEKRLYKTFVQDCGAVCWRCGRTPNDKPAWWNSPFLCERAHLVNSPRVESRKCCVLLCSLCHRIQHGDRFTYDLTSGGRFPLCTSTPLTLPELLAMKKYADTNHWDRKFLQTCSIRLLPPAATLKHAAEVCWVLRNKKKMK